MLTPELQKRIDDIISSYKVVLFMKWTPESPQCGFSANAVATLVESDIYFESFDIYSDEEIRQWLKEYKKWPTFPQLYIEGELIWGIDIMMEMFEAGEFTTLKKEQGL
jgi:Grx4 family monothiol glutaredoxin